MSAEQRRIELTENEDGWWTARERSIGVTTQGETREKALDNLDEVIDAVEGDGGHAPTDEELRAAGIDPDDNRQAGSGELPEVLRD